MEAAPTHGHVLRCPYSYFSLPRGCQGEGTFPPCNPSTHFCHRDDVDGLRCLAVVAVVVYHLDEALFPAGFVGVDVFFAISGYVVQASLHRRRQPGPLTVSTASSFLSSFYARRMKRLLPSFLLVVAVVSVVAYACVAQEPYKNVYTADSLPWLAVPTSTIPCS